MATPGRHSSQTKPPRARNRKEPGTLERRLSRLKSENTRLRAALQNSWDATILIDRTARIRYVSPSVTRISGFLKTELLGRKSGRLIHPSDRAAIRALLKTRPWPAERLQPFKIRLRHKDGTWRWVEGMARDLLAVPSVHSIVVNLQDVTEREAAFESDRRLAGIIQSSHDAIVSTTLDGIITSWNAGAERMYGFSAAEMIGNPASALVPPDRGQELAGIFDRIRQGELVDSLDTVHRTKSGGEVYISLIVSPLRGYFGEITGASVIARDMTGWRDAQEKLRQSSAELENMSRHLLRAQEAERARISRELHDQIGQTLLTIKFGLRSIESQVPSLALAQEMEESIASIDRAISQVRDLTFDLRPMILDDLGFLPALRTFLDRIARRAGLAAHFEADERIHRLAPLEETIIYRVAQEALTNVVRHANAHNVWVTLRSTDGQILLDVRDDGVGFDTNAIDQAQSSTVPVGLLGMKERAQLAGGQVEVESSPGQGTQVSLHFPVLQREVIE